MKLTLKDYALFKQYCAEYQKKFELNNWEISYEFKPLVGVWANCALDLEAHKITIALASTWSDEVTTYSKQALKKTAKHEMLHLLVGRFSELASYRYVLRRELESAEHELVQKLQVLIPN